FNPQEALDAPRWQWTGGNKILLEPEYPEALAEKLSARGHEIEYAENSGTFGRGEIIFRHDDGVLTGAVEKRAAGYCAAW
ncbi:MAG: gamma-glutamyltransferase, partial [Clostridia bacterium]|nr:gamma-glutamyltransferase [Clostridia bacterium]